MATKADMQAAYNYMDQWQRLSLGESADITCAMFRGDFSKSLEQAQGEKHEYILQKVGFRPGWRILDIGCGWGPILRAVEQRRGTAIGITLSNKQVDSCRRNGLNAHLLDWRNLDTGTYGTFDSIVSVGAFEHFCSPDEYLAGKQDKIYNQFFALCHALLPKGAKMYLQTMVWGKKRVEPSDLSLAAKKGSDARILAGLLKFYPGSWLPYGMEQIQSAMLPYFQVQSNLDGRLDYIETLNRFRRKVSEITWRKFVVGCRLLPRYAVDANFRYQLESLFGSYNRECFIREIMGHCRMILARTSGP